MSQVIEIRTTALLLGAALLLGLVIGTSSEAATRWHDVRFDIGSERNVRTVAYDPKTGRVFALTRLPFQTTPQIAAYALGRSQPIWKRTFAPLPNEYSGGMSFGSDLLIRPKRHLVYVGGGYLRGTGAGPFTSAGWIYAFDTRTGRKVWSHADRSSPGMGSIYNHLESGVDGSVIGFSDQYRNGPDNQTGSYSIEITSFDQRGKRDWRWVDTRRGLVSDSTTTSGGLVVFIGETYIDGWARGYRTAIHMRAGRLAWRKLSTDPYEFNNAITMGGSGRTLYIAGSRSTDDGSRAALSAVKATTGRFLWKRQIEPPSPAVTGDVSYYSASAVTSSREGPCVTGKWAGRKAVTYEPILPDDGFIACYSWEGNRQWIDRSAGGQGRVLQSAGHRLLWMGRQESSRDDTYDDSNEVVRFQIRSLANGSVSHSSQRLSTTDSWEPSKPLLAVRRNDRFHFVLSTATGHDGEGNVTSPDGLLNRMFR